MAIEHINGGPNGDTVAVGFHKTNENFKVLQKQVDVIPKYEIASTSEAETGIDDSKVMTAKKVRAAIKAQGGGVGGAKHVHVKARNVYEFTAPSDTDTITLPAEIFTPGGDYINLYMYGVRLDENEHYVLNGNVITLSFTLKAGEPIDYEIYKTTFSWNDLVHKPDFSSNSEALAGTNNDTIMTPLRVAEVMGDWEKDYNVKGYVSLHQIGLSDEQFAGKTEAEAVDLLLSHLLRYQTMSIRLDSSVNNFRLSFAGSVWHLIGTGLLNIETFTHNRYVAWIHQENGKKVFYKSGFAGATNSVWTLLSSSGDVVTYFKDLESIGLNDSKMSDTDIGGNIKQIIDKLPINSSFRCYVKISPGEGEYHRQYPRLGNSIKINTENKSDQEGWIEVKKGYGFVNTSVPIRVTYEINSNGTQNGLYIGWWDNNWTGFFKVATTIKSNDLQLLNGWKVDRTLSVSKIGGTLILTGGIHAGNTAAETIVMNLPVEFRPKSTVVLTTHTMNSSTDISHVELTFYTNGNVMLNSTSNQYIKLCLNIESQ